MPENLTVTVRPLTRPDELHARFQGQSEAQPAYVELGLEDGILLASYSAEVGNGVSASVYHGIDRRWSIPVLTQDAGNRLLGELAPLAQRVLDGSEILWDGNNRVGRVVTEDAEAAYDEITERCEGIEDHDGNEDLLPIWSTDSIGDLWDAEEAGVTAHTTDEELDGIEERLTEEFRDGQGLEFVVIEGLDNYLKQLRDDLAAQAD
ncbi:hypothetical protein ACFVGY_23900 [Streptomyces sp. NPDC127106]|uniref:hypothetical protein n=1 Tax=Streptomyces sp. NPDC127106 TaxID=3345360 RepID=UPI003641BF17